MGTVLKREKTWKCKSEGRRCAWRDFTSRTRRMHRETASEIAGYVLPLVFYARSGEYLDRVLCVQRHTTTCMSRHILKVAARLVPPYNPINALANSLGPRYHSFPKWAVRNWPVIVTCGNFNNAKKQELDKPFISFRSVSSRHVLRKLEPQWQLDSFRTEMFFLLTDRHGSRPIGNFRLTKTVIQNT